MTEKRRIDFCTICRKETELCAEGGEKMSIPGLIDKNVQKVDEQYMAAVSEA